MVKLLWYLMAKLSGNMPSATCWKSIFYSSMESCSWWGFSLEAHHCKTCWQEVLGEAAGCQVLLKSITRDMRTVGAGHWVLQELGARASMNARGKCMHCSSGYWENHTYYRNGMLEKPPGDFQGSTLVSQSKTFLCNVPPVPSTSKG